MQKDHGRYKQDYPISWEQLHRDARALARRLHDMRISWKKIVAVTRGGLVPSAIVARALSILFIDTVCVTSYDWQRQGESTILKQVAGNGTGCLVIDDLVDTGSHGKGDQNHAARRLFCNGICQTGLGDSRGSDSPDTGRQRERQVVVHGRGRVLLIDDPSVGHQTDGVDADESFGIFLVIPALDIHGGQVLVVK